jgi:hypothetical protein
MALLVPWPQRLGRFSTVAGARAAIISEVRNGTRCPDICGVRNDRRRGDMDCITNQMTNYQTKSKDALYGRRWKRRARLQLMKEPLCAMCEKEGKIVAAQVADHIEPHRGDINKFWMGRLQSLCAAHHNSSKQQKECNGFSTEIGADGWPLDRRHPFYQTNNK